MSVIDKIKRKAVMRLLKMAVAALLLLGLGHWGLSTQTANDFAEAIVDAGVEVSDGKGQ
tara:strand:- start:2657 stop:2833 length:177 start_codon:yes stop_codon:yes gene_type:complete